MSGVDGVVERVGRWTAKRSTRRSFLGRMGQLGVMVAGGTTIAGLLADQADARVCGQSGVSPQCPTYDCNDVWGWCWYANGCCADGLLKKICDCCAVNWPNVHGYCPSGTNVKCIVESCGTDPRVQRVGIGRIALDDAGLVEEFIRTHKFPNGAPVAVLADRDWPEVVAVAMPLGGMLHCPVVLHGRGTLELGVYGALKRLGATDVKIVGEMIPRSVDEELVRQGFNVERIGTAVDPSVLSGEVATWVAANLGPRNVVAIAAHGLSLKVAPLAAAFAHVMGLPLTIGADTPRAGGGMYMVGPELHHREGDFPFAYVVRSLTYNGIAAELATLGKPHQQIQTTIMLAPREAPFLYTLAGAGYPILTHEPFTLAHDARDFLFRHRSGINRVDMAGVDAALRSAGIYELQSILNGFEAHKLIGVGGQGLPVITQPLEERPVGRARLGTDPAPARTGSSYWTGRSTPSP